MIHSRFRRCLASIRDSILHRTHRDIYASMKFTSPEDFQAACIAIRDRHGQTE